jgi:hypothetical protein
MKPVAPVSATFISGPPCLLRLGDYFAEVLLLDQRTDAARARADLGWAPSRPGLVDDFRHGSYRTERAIMS